MLRRVNRADRICRDSKLPKTAFDASRPLPQKTVFVGANNSGKTSAITALRYFLVDRERSSFCFNDFTLSHWPAINAMGAAWEADHVANQPLPEPEWDRVLPFLDVWLRVADNEVHYVQKILPTLD